MARILLIDDEPDLLELCQLSLESAGYEVETLSQGVDAIACTREFRPDIIGLDWVIPDLSGEQILKQLKSSPELSPIPVVVISALDGLEPRARRLGAIRVLAKPFDRRTLVAAFDDLVPDESVARVP